MSFFSDTQLDQPGEDLATALAELREHHEEAPCFGLETHQSVTFEDSDTSWHFVKLPVQIKLWKTSEMDTYA